jgi:hypothetical protein
VQGCDSRPAKTLVAAARVPQTGRRSEATAGLALPAEGPPVDTRKKDNAMKWNSKLARALFVATTIGAMVLSAIAETGWS